LNSEDFVNLRRAIVDDIPSLMHLERQCPAAAHWTRQQYERLFQNDERLLLVAEESPHIVSGPAPIPGANPAILGFLIARHLALEWELENIVVAPAARRRGIGTRLLHALLADARETNSNAVFLEVRESNVAARNLYEKAGFDQTGRRRSYYASPSEDAILYRKSLD
jgi:ribosomal-protein-alanine acetyltransferase